VENKIDPYKIAKLIFFDLKEELSEAEKSILEDWKGENAENTQQELFDSSEINNLIIEEETHRLIYNAINELPAQCRKVLLLSINGLKNNDIAQELDITVNTVKTQKKIAYKQLKIMLKDIYAIVGMCFGKIL
jgi:RNA polymerase sigma factor (sigma-70 family)